MFVEKKKENSKQESKSFINLLTNILTILLVLLALSRITNILTINYVVGESMYPNLHPNDIVVGSNIPKILEKLNYGDILTIKEPDGTMIIKRLIGKPGDTISIENNNVFLNGEKINEEYSYFFDSTIIDVQQITLSNGQYFVLGDNRCNSRDSRYFGPINENQIISKVLNYK